MPRLAASFRFQILLAGLVAVNIPFQPASAQTAPDAPAAAFDIKAGEIQFAGQVTAIDGTGGFTLNVRAFTLPSGKNSRLAAVKPKAVAVEAATVFQSVDGKRKLAITDLKVGTEVLVTGKDLGTGKPLPARLVVIEQAPAEVPAEPKAPARPGEEIRTGEVRIEGLIEGVMASNSFLVGAIASTNASGKTREFDERESWNAILPADTLIRGLHGGAKYKNADLKLRLRVAVVGTPAKGEKTIRAREVVILDDIDSNTKKLGTVMITREVSELLRRADRYKDDGLFEKAIPILQQALKAAQLADDGNGESLALNRLGNAYQALDQPKKALEVLQQAVTNAHQRGNTSNAAHSLANFANALAASGLNDKAIEALEQSLELQKNLDEKPLLGHSLVNLAAVYREAGQWQKALEAIQRAVPVFQQLRDTESELEVRIQLMRAYGGTKQFENGVQTAQVVLKMLEGVEDKNVKGGALISIGMAFARAKQYPAALDHMKQAQAILAEVASKEMEAVAKSLIERIEEARDGKAPIDPAPPAATPPAGAPPAEAPAMKGDG